MNDLTGQPHEQHASELLHFMGSKWTPNCRPTCSFNSQPSMNSAIAVRVVSVLGYDWIFSVMETWA
eukprot:6335467-Amphidinium_carterae.1